MYKLFGRSSLLILLTACMSVVYAGSFSEFKKSQSDTLVTYLDEKDKSFHQYLTSNWEEYSSTIALPFYSKQKPNKIGRARKLEVSKRGPIIHILKINDSNRTMDLKTGALKKASVKKGIEIDFFGGKLGFTYPSGIKQAKFYPQSKKGINNFFNVLMSTEYEKLLDEINQVALDMNLNDWGKYLLIKKISENIFTSQDDSRLLRWFIFNKLGYAVRVGLAKKHVLVMYASKNIIYDTPIYKIDNNNFYIISNYAKGSGGNVFSYKQNYPGSNKHLDLSMSTLPKLEKNTKRKILTFMQNMKKYSISYRYNQNMIDFMSTYPQVDYETFFNTPLDEQSYQDIVNGLRKYINGKKSSYGINFVLNFVQNAFKYEVDNAQFGREKVMFAEETLCYDKSDCEDRAILFAKLVKVMFKIGVVGVRYTDHMSTALYIPLKGDTVKVQRKRYVIADPSYRNASIGQGISKYTSKKPKSFIFLK